MSNTKKRIVLKLTGDFLVNAKTKTWDSSRLIPLIETIKSVDSEYQFGIVIGGGNIFRGRKEGVALDLQPDAADRIGILATMVNSLIIQDICKKYGLPVALFSALNVPTVATLACPESIQDALQRNCILIFMGGLGIPFFTTDTTAIVRALQMKASEVWKLTHVDGIYSADPKTDHQAQLYQHISYKKALEEKLKVCDLTALALAEQHNLVLRIFNGMNNENALLKATQDPLFGSTITQ